MTHVFPGLVTSREPDRPSSPGLRGPYLSPSALGKGSQGKVLWSRGHLGGDWTLERAQQQHLGAQPEVSLLSGVCVTRCPQFLSLLGASFQLLPRAAGSFAHSAKERRQRTRSFHGQREPAPGDLHLESDASQAGWARHANGEGRQNTGVLTITPPGRGTVHTRACRGKSRFPVSSSIWGLSLCAERCEWRFGKGWRYHPFGENGHPAETPAGHVDSTVSGDTQACVSMGSRTVRPQPSCGPTLSSTWNSERMARFFSSSKLLEALNADNKITHIPSRPARRNPCEKLELRVGGGIELHLDQHLRPDFVVSKITWAPGYRIPFSFPFYLVPQFSLGFLTVLPRKETLEQTHPAPIQKAHLPFLGSLG
ncbi:uncharacterized protein [Myotis yumanensis]|uniref:uncharacterized protein n=1 Tax=Myotis yumanensis TaxID=159337 RepID=UPI0038D06B00